MAMLEAVVWCTRLDSRETPAEIVFVNAALAHDAVLLQWGAKGIRPPLPYRLLLAKTNWERFCFSISYN
jgi:hypothetical protein